MTPSFRRLSSAAAAATVALLLLAGCSGSDQPEAGAAPASDGTFPLSIDHAFGTTVVPAEPKRVVSVGVTEQDTLLALGVIPVGVTDWYGDQPFAVWPWAQDLLGDEEPELLTTEDGLQFEEIAALEPDLIVGTNAGLSADDYEKLSKIAPTIAHSTSPYFEPWDDQAIAVGTAVGKEAEVTALVDAVYAQFDAAAAAHPEFADTSVYFLQNAIYDGSAIAYPDGLSTEFLTELGFTVPADIDDYASDPDEGGQAYIPLENFDVLNTADVLLWATETDEDRPALEAEPIFEALTPVKEGKLVYTDFETAGAIYFATVLSLPYVVDQLVPAFADTIAGKGPSAL